MSGHRYQVYRHRHIRQGLDDNQQSAAQHQEFRKELITSTSNHPHPDKQNDIQEQDKDTPDDSHLFYNNGIDKVRVSLRQKVALLPMSGELPEQTATCQCNLGMHHLVVVTVNADSSSWFKLDGIRWIGKTLDTCFPSVHTIRHQVDHLVRGKPYKTH